MAKCKKLLLCLLVLSLLLTAAACGKQGAKEVDPSGYYPLKSIQKDGEEVDPATLGMEKEEAFLLLNEDGTAALCLFGELTDLTWKNGKLRPVEGEDTDPIAFTLEEKLLTFELEDMQFTFRLSKDDPPDLDEVREALSKPILPDGVYVLDSIEAEGVTMDAAQLKDLGINAYIEFFDDGTGTLATVTGEAEDFTWEDGTIFSDGDKLTYTLDGDTLTVKEEEGTMVFIAGEKPEITPPVTTPDPDEDDLPSGRYSLTAVTVDGQTVSGDDLVTAGLSDSYIEFRNNGTATISAMGSTEELTWSGTTLTDSVGIKQSYLYDDDTVTIEMNGMKMVFSETDPDDPADDFADYWDGDWYGWWMIDNGTGDYAELSGSWWDICAEIDMEENGAGTMVFWDEDFTQTEPLGTVNVQISKGDSSAPHGYLSSGGGLFECGEIGKDDWAVSPDENDYADCLVFTGTMVSSTNSEDSYEYMIVLRPWGKLWDDMEEDSRPYYYTDWYLPLIEAGEDMPDHITTE